MTYKGAVVVNGVNYGHRLPRGRHGIPRELVTANQQERLLKATTTIFADEGYASLAIRNVIDRAGVSRATFYKLFEGKVELVLAAQERAFELFREAVLDACADRDWPHGVAAGVGRSLDFAAHFRPEALLLLASSHAFAEPRLARAGLAIQKRFEDLLEEGAERCPSARSPRGLTVRASVGAAMTLVANCMAAGELEDIAELKADLVQIVLTPFVGANEAKRIANERLAE
jgi:AcrR family transcriptional regulator